MKYIIKLTWKEIINKRILYLGMVFTGLYLLIFAVGLHYVVREENFAGNQLWFMQTMGFQFFTLGWYLSCYLIGAVSIMAGAGSIAQELEQGTMLGLAAKPLSRSAILTGKFITYALVAVAYSILLLTGITGLVWYFFHLFFDLRALAAGILVFCLYPLILLAVVHLLSSLVSTLATGISAFLLFSVAMIGGFLEQIGAMIGNNALVNLGIVSSLLMPSDAIYRMAVSRAGGMLGQGTIIEFGPFGAASTPSVWMLVYTAAFILVIYLATQYIFSRKDL